MKTRISASVGAIGLAFSLYSQISNAYILDFDNCNGNTFSHSWVPGNVTFTYLANTRPAGALNLQPALNRAVNTINNSIELNINLTLNVDNTTNAIVTTQADGNQIGYSATLLGANTLAAEFSSVFVDCTTSQFSARFAESDIVYPTFRHLGQIFDSF